MKKAVIYCRVSSKQQVENGHGLDNQEQKCRDYAIRQGHDVIKVFREEGISGGSINRPTFEEMADYISKINDEVVVIFYDIKRLARDVILYYTLKQILASVGATVESPNFTFEDTPENELMEGFVALTGKYEKDTNKRNVLKSMDSRLRKGYWTFYHPPGYKYEKNPIHGKLLVKDEPHATTVKEALEGFAEGKFKTKIEVCRFLEAKQFPIRRKRGRAQITQTHVDRLFDQYLYAGYIKYDKWDVPLTKGHHEPIVSLETLTKIHDRLADKPKVVFRKDISEDFPLRGFVKCDCCSSLLTAAWTKGKTALHPYYKCRKKGCDMYGKSIRRDQLESDVSTQIKAVTPQNKLARVLCEMIDEEWSERSKHIEGRIKTLKNRVQEITIEVNDTVDKITKLSNPTALSALEKRIESLEIEKIQIEEKLSNNSVDEIDVGTLLKEVADFIPNTHKMWESGTTEEKKLLLELIFEDKITYSKNEGVRTLVFSPLYAIFSTSGTSKNTMVEQSASNSNTLYESLVNLPPELKAELKVLACSDTTNIKILTSIKGNADTTFAFKG